MIKVEKIQDLHLSRQDFPTSNKITRSNSTWFLDSRIIKKFSADQSRLFVCDGKNYKIFRISKPKSNNNNKNTSTSRQGKKPFPARSLKRVCEMEDGEYISCAKWVSIEKSNNNNSGGKKDKYDLLLLGTTEGFFHIINPDAKPKDQNVYSFQFNQSPMIRIKKFANWKKKKMSVMMSYSSGKSGVKREEKKMEKDEIFFSLIYSGIVISFSLVNLEIFLDNLQELGDDCEVSTFICTKWVLNGQKKTNDVVFLPNVSKGSILDVLNRKTHTNLICAGKNPCLSVFSSEKKVSSESFSATKIATKVTKYIFNVAKSWWGSKKEEKKVEKKNQISEEKIESSNNFFDPPRETLTLKLDSTNKFLITTDTLGRVIIFETENLIVIKLLKGYRNFCVGFLSNLRIHLYSFERGIFEIQNIPKNESELIFQKKNLKNGKLIRIKRNDSENEYYLIKNDSFNLISIEPSEPEKLNLDEDL